MRTPEEELDQIRERNLFRELKRFDAPTGEGMRWDWNSRSVIHFGSNDYLGLARHPSLIESFRQAADQGVGSAASRLIVGTRGAHQDLEEALAAFKGTEAALSFSSGYATAVSVIPALIQAGDVVILDKLCHASLIDGARLSGATIRVFPHNDLDKLQSHLKWASEKVAKTGRILVVTESVFSMDGDLADLVMMAQLKDEVGALLLVDEAHSVGLYGKDGRGLANQLGIEGQIDFQMGTMSKAIGVCGGYLCAARPWIDLLINQARGFIYSTAPPPAIARTATAALELLCGSEGGRLREKLWLNARRLEVTLNSSQREASPIHPILVGEASTALAIQQGMLESGLFVPAIRYPTVPKNTARLRISLSADHTAGDIDSLGQTLAAVLLNQRRLAIPTGEA